MSFEKLEKKIQLFESNLSQNFLPNTFLIVSLELNGDFKDSLFSEELRDQMISLGLELMRHGQNCFFVHSYLNELKLAFSPNRSSYFQSVEQTLSYFSSEASSFLSLKANKKKTFKCKLIQLPQKENVHEYFDLITGLSQSHFLTQIAKKKIYPLSMEQKEEFILLLTDRGLIEFPKWKFLGAGIYSRNYGKCGVNSVTGLKTSIRKQRPVVDLNLPGGRRFTDLLSEIISSKLISKNSQNEAPNSNSGPPQ